VREKRKTTDARGRKEGGGRRKEDREGVLVGQKSMA
jgi:hypothetical protein